MRRYCAALVLSIAVVCLAFVGCALMASKARARDLDGRYAQAPLADWYKAQRSVSGQVCCDDADGHPVSDWGRGPNGYWAVYDGVRHDVPSSAMVNGSHPQGLAVVWIYPKGSDVVRCFLPGMEG
jgi:hypothetical protein